MKKIFKFLSLGMLFTLVSCSGNNTEPTPEGPKAESDGAILRKIADDMLDSFGANRENVTYSLKKSALDPADEEHRGPEAQLPCVLLYMTGVISDIEGVDVVNKALAFDGEFQYDFSLTEDSQNWVDMDIDFTLNCKMDRANNKIFFSGFQGLSMQSMPEPVASYIFIDISYNFATGTLGDFSLLMNQTSPTDIYYFEVVNGVASKSGSNVTPEESAAFLTTFNSYKSDFLALTTVVAEGTLLRAAQEAFVATQKYENKLFGQKVDSVRIKESE